MRNVHSLLCLLLLVLALDSANAQDSADLNRYQKQNETLGIPHSGENRVVFIGNSITESWLIIHPHFFADKPYINRGISGQTTPQILMRFKQDAINLKPSVVVILAGTNDVAGNTGPSTNEMISSNIKSMIELAKANNIGVVLCSIPPVTEFPWKKDLQPSEKIITLNEILKSYAVDNDIAFVDYYSALANEDGSFMETLSLDGVHPNARGYSIMENLVEVGITEARWKNRIHESSDKSIH